jgi:hypothetical protein
MAASDSNSRHPSLTMTTAKATTRQATILLGKDMLLAISNGDWQYGWSHLINGGRTPKSRRRRVVVVVVLGR